MSTDTYRIERCIVRAVNASTGVTTIEAPAYLGAGGLIDLSSVGLVLDGLNYLMPAVGSTVFVAFDTRDNAFLVSPPTGSGSGGAVDSVNGQTGVVILKSDDISDLGETHKFITQAQLDKLNGLTDFQYVHTQGVSSTVWTINHNLNGFPNVTTKEYAGNVVEGDVVWTSPNQVVVTFTASIDGTAYLS